MDKESVGQAASTSPSDVVFRAFIVVIEYAIVASLLIVAADVLVRTVIDFFTTSGPLPPLVVTAIDGILVVIILLDVAHTVFGNLRVFVFRVRPFLIIGVLAGIRDILSASARLSLSGSLSNTAFNDTLISLAMGVGVVFFLLLGLVILKVSHHDESDLSSEG
ncbi:MAG: hypothetical protein HIU84_09325 [Acidobacteria bacterium]|nr:hypothetical protein [Acidobacteriota bacterium]